MKKRPLRSQMDQSIFPQEKPIGKAGNGAWQLIALKAYELYEQRGREEGHALEDWLKAEAIVQEATT